MSPIGRIKGAGTSLQMQFQSRLFVGSLSSIPIEFRNVENVFPTLQAALAFIAAQTGAAAPSSTNKYLIDLCDPIIYGQEHWLPDWCFLRSAGQDFSALVEPVGSVGGDFIISVGVGSIQNLGIATGLIASNNFATVVVIRDSGSLYSLLQENFVIAPADTLVFRVDGGPGTITINLTSGTRTASQVAADINAQGGGNLIASDQLGRVRVRGFVPAAGDVLLELLGTGSANTIFGWPAAGTQTINPALDIELRVIRNVEISVNGAGQAGRYAVAIQDVSDFVTTIDSLRVQVSIPELVSGDSINGILYEGGVLNMVGVDFRVGAIGLELYDSGLAAGGNLVVMYNSVFFDTASHPRTQVMFHANTISLAAAACSYNPQKVQSAVSVQPTNITGVTINRFSGDTPAGTDGTLSYTFAGASLTWQAPGESTPGPAQGIGGTGGYILTADGGSTITIYVDAGSLPGTSQVDSDIVVFSTTTIPITQAGSIKLADQGGFFGPAWAGKDLEGAIEQLGIEIRSAYIPAALASTAGLLPPNEAGDGEINGFTTKTHVDTPQDQTAFWTIKLPPVATFGNRDAVLELHTAIAVTPTSGTDIKFDIAAKYVDDGQSLTAADDESLSVTFAAGTLNTRKDVSVALDKTKLAGNKWLRFEIKRDISVANNVDVLAHLMGISVRL